MSNVYCWFFYVHCRVVYYTMSIVSLSTMAIVGLSTMSTYCRFVYNGRWKFGDLLTLSAGQLAIKFILDSASKGRMIQGFYKRLLGRINAICAH